MFYVQLLDFAGCISGSQMVGSAHWCTVGSYYNQFIAI